MGIGAIILAAGLSTRMGACKPLLAIGSRTLLGHAITLFSNSGIDDIVVVVGHNSAEVIQEANRYRCRTILNEQYTAGMFSSIQVGVRDLAAKSEAFFLLPVDIPLVRESTIRQLMAELSREPGALVVYPEYQAQRGHPPLISSCLTAAIQSFDGQGGLRALLRRYQQQSRTIKVSDPYILLDADTANELDLLREQNLKRRFSH